MENKKNKKKIDIKKAVLIAFLFAFLIFIIFSFISQIRTSSMSFTIKRGRLADEELVKGIFIRNEQILGEEGKDLKLEKIKSEGSRISKGDNVFRYYSEDEQKVTEKIDEINKEINKYLQNQKININSPENQVINEQIRKIIDEIVLTSSQIKNKENLNNISERLEEKSKDGKIFENDENINKLNKEKAALEQKLNENTKMLKAPFAGVVSYKIDGYENKLKWEEVENLTDQQLKNIDIKPGMQIPSSNTNGKIIDNFSMYILTKTNNKNPKKKKEGEYIKVRIRDEVINAQIVKLPNPENKSDKILILKITQNVEKLIDTRSSYLDLIWWEKEGLKVSNRAIEKEKGFSFVEKNKWTYKEKVLVKIVEETEEFSLIENYTSDELKELGIDISEERPFVQEDDELIITSSQAKKEEDENEKNKQSDKKSSEKTNEKPEDANNES